LRSDKKRLLENASFSAFGAPGTSFSLLPRRNLAVENLLSLGVQARALVCPITFGVLRKSCFWHSEERKTFG